MEESKISAAEIAELRQKAETEREVRHQILDAINGVRIGRCMSSTFQMKILFRDQKQEIMAMLDAYRESSSKGYDFVLCDHVQMCLYKNRYVDRKAWLFLLENLPLCYKLEEQMLRDINYAPQRKLSAKAELFFLENRLTDKKCLDGICCHNFFDNHFKSIRDYFKKFDLYEASECYLVQAYLEVNSGREQYIESCRQVVKDYIMQKKALSERAERLLIASGEHSLIMQYIQTAVLKSENALLERGNREEVITYFERYATL